MTRRIWEVLAIGVIGCAILIALGVWQSQRLPWKQAILAEIDARIGDAPVALPADPDPVEDRFLPVQAQGVLGEGGIRVLVSAKFLGAGYRILRPLETDGRRVIVDLGFVPVETDTLGPPAGTQIDVIGNLHWPDEVDNLFPTEPDLGRNIWFARDVGPVSDALGTEPILIIARSTTPALDGFRAMPVSSAGIPNNHLQYAITWFSLAAIWLGMTLYWLWRIRQRTS